MVLVSLILFMKTFYPEEIENVRENFKVDNTKKITFKDYSDKSKFSMLGMVFMSIFIILNVIPAILVANACTKNPILKLIKLIFAILFSDIYLFFHIFKVYGLKNGKVGFCGDASMRYCD